jgi:catecholate siderophore receptor
MYLASHLIVTAVLSFALTARANAQVSPTASPDTVAPSAPVDSAVIVDTLDVLPPTPVLAPVKVSGIRRPRGRYTPGEISTATRTTLPLRDIPQAVTVINRVLIADQSMQGLVDVVRYVPGITMGQGEGNRDQPTIRGNSTTADFFVDGMRDDAQYFRDLYNVERVEAFKGSNAMAFGRGGGGGVINRAMKEADWHPLRELTLQGGSYNNRRMTADVGKGFMSRLAGRINAVYENSDLFRDGATLERRGIHPTTTFLSASENTRVTLGYENFIDRRTADRGIPSFAGRPFATDPSTFFGNPALSYSEARVHSSAATLTQRTNSGFGLRNSTRFTTYEKSYQNVFPASLSADGADVTLSAYNNSHTRRNLLSQTDLTYLARTGVVSHSLLVGAELGRQVTDNFRETGYFSGASTSFSVPAASPTSFEPVTFRQSATDADNRVTNTVASIYAQDQVAISPHLQVLAGVRYEKFGIRYHNNRTDSTLRRSDAMLSPRVGLVVKPGAPASLYASYSVSYLPSAGDQFSSLTDVTKALEPERFRNLEIGVKWDVADRISATAAAYQLDRTNTRAPSPNNPAQTVQTGSQRSKGYELGLSGSITPNWDMVGGFARQQALIMSTTAAAQSGATVPLVPGNSFSLWNRYQLFRKLGLGVGVVHQTDMYATIDNTVVLPAFTRIDGGLFLLLGAHLRAQMNLENLLNEKYYPLAHNNHNITPGSPRALRLSLTTAF